MIHRRLMCVLVPFALDPMDIQYIDIQYIQLQRYRKYLYCQIIIHLPWDLHRLVRCKMPPFCTLWHRILPWPVSFDQVLLSSLDSLDGIDGPETTGEALNSFPAMNLAVT